MSRPKPRTGPRQNRFQFKGFNLILTATAILLVLGGGIVIATSSTTKNVREISLAPLSQMPDYVQSAPPTIQEAYQFAAANPELLDHMPCYCGCGNMGHKHNLHCYVKSFNSDGSVAEFDNHAAY